MQALAEAQLDVGHTVNVITLTPEEGHVAEINGVKVHYVGLKNFYWPFGHDQVAIPRKLLWHVLDSFNPFMRSSADDVLATETPDVVHTHNLTGFSASVWRAATRRGRPVVHTLRDYSLLCPKATMFFQGKNCSGQHWSCRALSLPRMALSRHLYAVTAISRYILDRHVAAGIFSSVAIREVIHNPLPVVSGGARPTKLRDTLAFGFIGQLSPVKGIETLLQAFTKLDDNKCELIIAGEGDPAYERELRKLAQGRRVRFIGRTRPEDFYPSIDALIVPSLWHEPLGRVILEAYAYGIPVLASERGGIPEIVDHLGTGFLFDPGRPEALQRGLRLLLDDPSLLENLALNASRKAKQFLPKKVCAQYDAVYSRITG